MIRILRGNDLAAVMQIWLKTNRKAHDFISENYWTDNYATVNEILPQAEVYVYEDDTTNQIDGFIGFTDNNYIAGIFVREAAQSKGIGKQLLNYAKEIKSTMILRVYQKNTRAVSFYQREQFAIQSENVDDSTNEKEYVMTWSKKTK
ncbi:MAG: N-acetyltransferase [Eubacteriales bacterium]|nr:N-acetyltransferase [Eubacteriales bacterium]